MSPRFDTARLEAFSDGVFAIAIIIAIAVPVLAARGAPAATES